MARKAQRAGRGSRLGRWAARRAVGVRARAGARGAGGRAGGRRAGARGAQAGRRQRARHGADRRAGARQGERGARLGARCARGTAGRQHGRAACARRLGQLGQVGVLCTLTRFFWPGSTR